MNMSCGQLKGDMFDMARKRISHPFDINRFQHREAAHIPLGRDRITQSAVRLLNEFGLKELSMRKAAEDLMVKPASLYCHVKSRDELLQWIADRICSELTQHDPSLPWAEQILQQGEQYRGVLHSYRDAVEIFNSTIGISVSFSYHRLTIKASYKLAARCSGSVLHDELPAGCE
jgi:AcrR family transcriptional regulator